MSLQQLFVVLTTLLLTMTWKAEYLPLGLVQDRMISAFGLFGASHFKSFTGLASAISHQSQESHEYKCLLQINFTAFSQNAKL